MTTASPDDFDFSQMAQQLSEIDAEPSVVNVRTLDNGTLLNLYAELNHKLESLREEMVPRTDEGRETHSLRAACLVELKQRQLL